MFHFTYLKLTVSKSPGNSWGRVQHEFSSKHSKVYLNYIKLICFSYLKILWNLTAKIVFRTVRERGNRSPGKLRNA